MADRPTASPRSHRALRTAGQQLVWDALQDVLARRADATVDPTGRQDEPQPLDVLDVGGGTGGFAVPLAELGHRVTVVDPSPDALASLQRRAGEVGVSVRAVQGEAAGLPDIAAPDSIDLVLCHGVLEHVDELDPALTALAGVLRPSGVLSLLAANRNAVVLARAISGHFDQATQALRDPDGRFGPGDPLPRRFTADQLVELVRAQGLAEVAVHGVRIFADLVPGALVDAEPGAADQLLDLERAAADHDDFRSIATQLHVLAVRPMSGAPPQR
jgi:SAM-dependent methyltransferase